MSIKKERPGASQDYVVEGVLHQRGPFDYVFKPKTWEPVPGSWSLAEFRYETRQAFALVLHSKLHRPRTASFLYSLVSGEVKDRQLRYEFGRLGLQHILAISGFHFGLLMASFSAGLGLFLSRHWKWGLMLVCATDVLRVCRVIPSRATSVDRGVFVFSEQSRLRPTGERGQLTGRGFAHRTDDPIRRLL